MHEFPRYGAGQELTAQQVNAFLDQMRRQARVFAVPPLDAVQTPDGWLVRLNAPPGFWAVLGGRTAGNGSGSLRYDYAETVPDSLGRWQTLPGGRAASGTGGAVEVNGRADLAPGTVVWMTGTATADPSGGSAVFAAPVADEAVGPAYFWARLLAQADGFYGYTRLRHTERGFVDDPDPLGYESEDAPALEATGRTDAAAGSVVLMRLAPGPDQHPVFSTAAVAAGFWAKTGTQPRVTELELTRNRFERTGAAGPWPTPAGGTWSFQVYQQSGGALLGTSGPLAFDATADEIAAEVEAMTELVYGTLAVSGEDGGPWFFAFQNDLAGNLAFLIFDSSGLDYGDAPPLDAGGGSVSGPDSGYVYTATTGGGTGWLEVERSKGGSWQYARTPRFVQFAETANPDVTALPGAVAFLEPGGTTAAGGSVRPTISPTGFALTDAAGTALAHGDASAARVLPDGAGALVVVGAAGGTFRVRYQGLDSAPLAHDATAEEVAEAVNAGLSSDLYRVAGSLGPLTTGVRLDWEDPAVGDGSAAATRYYIARAYSEPSNWLRVEEGHSRVAPKGYSFSEIWELRTYHPAGDTARPTGGTFTLAYGDAETAEIAFDATRQDIQDELEPLAGRGTLACVGGPLPAPVRVYFQGDLSGAATAGLSVASSALTDAGAGDAVATVFRPAALLVRSHGPTYQTAAGGGGYTLTSGGQSVALEFTATGTQLAQSVGQTFAAVGTRRVAGEGESGCPLRLVFKDTLALAPPAFTTSVPGGSPYTASATAGDAAGASAAPDGGAVKLCVGAQWKLELTSGAGSSFKVSVNGTTTNFAGQPMTVTHGMTAATVAALLVTSEMQTINNGIGGTSATGWLAGGGPLGTAPVFLDLFNWPCNRTVELAATDFSFVAPAQPTVRMTAVTREEFADDYYAVEFSASSPAPVGGTWTMPNLADASAAPVLPYDATASQVLAAVTGYTRTVGAAYAPLSFATQPYSEATATGGPLPGAPVVVRVPTGRAAHWRKYTGGLAPAWPYDGMFTPDTAGLTRPPAGAGPATGAVTWLGTAALAPATWTAATVEAALRATPYGGGVRCAAATDAVGGIVLAVPDYAGEPVAGNLAHRFSAFGYADGGRLRFYSNCAPQECAGAVAPVGAEANLAWATTGFTTQPPGGQVPQHADADLGRAAVQALRARVLRDGPVAPPLYSWVELAPGPGRTPRADDQRHFAYNGIGDYSGQVYGGVRAARELAGYTHVPHGTEVWLDPQAGYAFRWTGPRPVPRYARAYTGAAYLSGQATDVFDNGLGQFTSFAPRLLLEADPDDPRLNSGRALPALVAVAQGRYTGAFPDRTEEAGATWSIPVPAYRAPGLLAAATSFVSSSQPGFAGDTVSTGGQGLWQALGDGDKAVLGTAFLFPPGNESAAFSGLTAAWNAPGSGLSVVNLATVVAPAVVAPGRSLMLDVTLSLSADRLSPCNLHLGAWGTVGPFTLGAPVAHVQGLLDALLGADQGRVIEIHADGFRYGWQFSFAGGTYGRRDPGSVTVDAPYTVSLYWGGPLDGSADNFQTLTAAIGETRLCRAGGGGGGVRYDDVFGSGVGYYHTVRHVTFGGYVGPGIATQSHSGANTFPGGGSSNPGVPDPAVTLEVAAGTVQFPISGRNLPGSRFVMQGRIPLECSAGRGYPTAAAGNYAAFGVTRGVAGCYFEFHGGLCTHAESVTPALYTGTFPTRDGRTATVVGGFITSVA